MCCHGSEFVRYSGTLHVCLFVCVVYNRCTSSVYQFFVVAVLFCYYLIVNITVCWWYLIWFQIIIFIAIFPIKMIFFTCFLLIFLLILFATVEMILFHLTFYTSIIRNKLMRFINKRLHLCIQLFKHQHQE